MPAYMLSIYMHTHHGGVTAACQDPVAEHARALLAVDIAQVERARVAPAKRHTAARAHAVCAEHTALVIGHSLGTCDVGSQGHATAAARALLAVADLVAAHNALLGHVSTAHPAQAFLAHARPVPPHATLLATQRHPAVFVSAHAAIRAIPVCACVLLY